RPLALESVDTAEPRQRYFPCRLPIALEDPRHSVRILNVRGDEASADIRGLRERGTRLGNDRPPGDWSAGIDRDDAPERRAIGGLEIELVGARTDEGVERIPIGKHRVRLPAPLAQVDHINGVFLVAVEECDDEVAAV